MADYPIPRHNTEGEEDRPGDRRLPMADQPTPERDRCPTCGLAGGFHDPDCRTAPKPSAPDDLRERVTEALRPYLFGPDWNELRATDAVMGVVSPEVERLREVADRAWSVAEQRMAERDLAYREGHEDGVNEATAAAALTADTETTDG